MLQHTSLSIGNLLQLLMIDDFLLCGSELRAIGVELLFEEGNLGKIGLQTRSVLIEFGALSPDHRAVSFAICSQVFQSTLFRRNGLRPRVERGFAPVRLLFSFRQRNMSRLVLALGGFQLEPALVKRCGTGIEILRELSKVPRLQVERLSEGFRFDLR